MEDNSQDEEATLLGESAILNSTIDEAIGVLAVTFGEKLKARKAQWASLNVGIAPFLDEAMKARELQDDLMLEQKRRKAAERQATSFEQQATILKRRVAQVRIVASNPQRCTFPLEVVLPVSIFACANMASNPIAHSSRTHSHIMEFPRLLHCLSSNKRGKRRRTR